MAGAADNYAAETPEITTFEATVTSVDGRSVTLEQTYFYAEGGGQPADRGTIDGIAVADVQSRDDRTVHTLAEPPTFAPGETVTGRIDADFRTYCQRAHTASHIVYGAGRRLFETPEYGGFDIASDRVRIDFATERDASDVDPLTVQEMVNQVVWEDRAVEWYERETTDARADDSIVFNLEDDELGETVRIVDIDGWDVSACGGTHVYSTGEIGYINVLGASNPGAGLVRIEYAVGPAAIEAQLDASRAARTAAERLDTDVAGLPGRVADVTAEVETQRERATTLANWGLEARLDALAANAEDWAVGTVTTVDANTVSEFLRDRDSLPAPVVAFVGAQNRPFLVVGTPPGNEHDANGIVQTVTDEFGGGGGGQPTLAQGGGIDAEPTAVVEYLRDLAS